MILKEVTSRVAISAGSASLPSHHHSYLTRKINEMKKGANWKKGHWMWKTVSSVDFWRVGVQFNL